jgi:hypothetical protein
MPSDDRPRWPLIGLSGVIIAFVGLGALYAMTVPKFLPADETSHVGYALSIGHGDLPRLDSKVPDEIPGLALQYEIRREIYTANHPPLYYLPVSVPLRIGVATGHPVLGFELARLLTVALTAIGAVATCWAARLLVPGRPDVAVLAAAIAVLLPAVPRFAGVVYNDGFSLAMAAVGLATSVWILVRGPSRWRLAGVATAAAALTLTRAVGIPAAGLMVGATAVAVLLHSPRPALARVVRAGAAGALVASCAFAASGWFWLRSRHLYGDIAGSAYNLDRFGYGPRGTTAGMITDGHWPQVLYRQLWGRVYDSAEYAVGRGAAPGALFALLVVSGLLALGVRWWRSRPRPSITAAVRSADPATRGRMVGWCLVLGWLGLVYVSTINYIASGGGVHGRYLLPGMPAAALLAAVAIGALPGRRRAVAPVLTVAVLSATGLLWAARFADALRPSATWWGAAMTRTASESNGVPAVAVWLAVVLTVAGTAMAGVALFQLAIGRASTGSTESVGADEQALSEPLLPGGPGRR